MGHYVFPSQLTNYRVALNHTGAVVTVGTLAGAPAPESFSIGLDGGEPKALGAFEVVAAGPEAFLLAASDKATDTWQLSYVDIDGTTRWSNVTAPADYQAVTVAGENVVIVAGDPKPAFYSTRDGAAVDGTHLEVADPAWSTGKVVPNMMPATVVLGSPATFDVTTGDTLDLGAGRPFRAGSSSVLVADGDHYSVIRADEPSTSFILDDAGLDEIAVCDDRFYTGGNGQLSVYDAANPHEPVSTRAIDDGDVEGILVAAGVVAVTTLSEEAQVTLRLYRAD